MELSGEAIKLWAAHPDAMVEQLFKVTPDKWQLNVLQAFPHKQRIAMCASRGPGKTAVEAWCGWNYMLTRPQPKIAATSITGDNLANNLWPEFSKWQQKSPLLKEMFTFTKTRIFAKDHPETWFISARTWPKSASNEEIGNTLAGLHADYILFLIDESGGIPEAIGIAAEAALSSCVEGHILQAGNTTSRKGMLYQAAVKNRKIWHVVEINGDPDNPERSERVDMEWARTQIETYGRDHPYVMVSILGKFPLADFNALIGNDEVEAAMKRTYRESEYNAHARIIGVDVAREGIDQSAVYCRQGLQAFTPQKYRNIDGTMGASLVARKWRDWDADACFIDSTGGFGSSWIDNLVRTGFAPIGVHFNEKSGDPKFYNKRTEIIFSLVEWIRRGGALPQSPEMLASLTEMTYTHKGDALLVEPKNLIKERLGFSPDEMDALALTFSQPVVRKSLMPMGFGNGMSRHKNVYNPLSREYVKEYLAGRN